MPRIPQHYLRIRLFFFFNANTVSLVNPVETGFFQTNFCPPLKNFLPYRRGLFYLILNKNKILELIIYDVLLNIILFYFYLYIDRIIGMQFFFFACSKSLFEIFKLKRFLGKNFLIKWYFNNYTPRYALYIIVLYIVSRVKYRWKIK